ncbi:hypothetical protein HZH68_005368 [Vespula germanica]|uniref:Uncharacterized protein n=1 Tax=Vespula germanica TaxID=30212 RepID=A0A834KDK1_VESGE|nr:hypothetical protein HZH68_005368 [Vespula germanica]
MVVGYVETVTASGDPWANDESILKFTFRDAFPLRELQLHRSTPSASDIGHAFDFSILPLQSFGSTTEVLLDSFISRIITILSDKSLARIQIPTLIGRISL